MLKWIMKNRPLGGGFINRGKKEAEVETVWENEGKTLEIRRHRNKSEENFYWMTGYDKPFTSFGTNPPTEIIEALNLSDINIQDQFSPYFLVFDSPGQAAEYIRAITGLVEIDKVADDIKSKIYKNNSAIGEKEESLKDLDLQLSELAQIPLVEFEEILGELEDLIVAKKKGEEIWKGLKQVLDQIVELEGQKISIPEKEVVELKKKLETLTSRYESNRRSFDSLNLLISSWKELEAQRLDLPGEEIKDLNQEIQTGIGNYSANEVKVFQLGELVKSWESLEAEKLEISSAVEIEAVGEDIKRHQELQSKLVSLYDLIVDIKGEKAELTSIQTELKILKEEEQKMLSELTDCPSCGTKLTDESRTVLLGQ
jgi:DNA repair exonuclease SbcCD ATPase subunit